MITLKHKQSTLTGCIDRKYPRRFKLVGVWKYPLEANIHFKAILCGLLGHYGIKWSRLIVTISNCAVMGLLNVSWVHRILKEEIPACRDE